MTEIKGGGDGLMGQERVMDCNYPSQLIVEMPGAETQSVAYARGH